MFRRTAESVTVDVPAFEHARAAIPDDAALVLTPSHRSYLDFVLVSYLAFARPDLIPLPHVAATSEFLPPKRGLLRCLQASGRTCALLPIAIRYDRVPEQEAFAHELAGNPKPTMGMAALLSWMFDAWRGRVDVGRIHISCAAPVLLDATSDVHACSHEVIRRLRQTMAGMVNPTSPISSTGMHQPHVADAWQPASATSRYTGVEAAG
jgi:glycerol-3-phosphate O-acyltransferase